MKNIIEKILKIILKYKRKLVYSCLALVIAQIFLFNVGGVGYRSQVFAEDAQTQSKDATDKAEQWQNWLKLFNKILPVLLYPMIYLAGWLVDNSFVYGENFGFDALLWELWNMVKNIANFGLGFLFVYKVFEMLIKKDAGYEKELANFLKKALIAGVGIQASRFLMAVLIDISTILTYTVGSLPITVLENVKGESDRDVDKYDPYVLSAIAYMDAENVSDSSIVYLTDNAKNPQHFIAPCSTFLGISGDQKEELIIAPSMVYYTAGSEVKKTEKNECHIGMYVYKFAGLSVKWEEVAEGTDMTGAENAQKTYEASLNEVKNSINGSGSEKIQNLIRDGNILKIESYGWKNISGNNVILPSEVFSKGTGDFGLDENNSWLGKDWGLKKMSDMLNQSKSFLGVFSSMYTSLLVNATESLQVGGDNSSVYVSVLNSFMQFACIVAIGIPLIVLVFVLFVRIGVIWLAIVLSPLIVLLQSFDLYKKISSGIHVDFLKYLEIGELIKIIFSPAVVCFAVSLCTILIHLINQLNLSNISMANSEFLGGLITLNIGSMTIGLGKFISSLMCVLITWYLMRFAIQSNKIGESGLVKGMKELAESAIGSAKIVPIPGGGRVGISSIVGNGNGSGGMVSQITSGITRKLNSEDNRAVEKIINPGSVSKFFVEGLTEFVGNNDNKGKLSSWTTAEIGSEGIFDSLSDSNKEKVIQEINKKQELVKKLGENKSEIKIGSKIYKYLDDGTGKKEYREEPTKTTTS